MRRFTKSGFRGKQDETVAEHSWYWSACSHERPMGVKKDVFAVPPGKSNVLLMAGWVCYAFSICAGLIVCGCIIGELDAAWNNRERVGSVDIRLGPGVRRATGVQLVLFGIGTLLLAGYACWMAWATRAHATSPTATPAGRRRD